MVFRYFPPYIIVFSLWLFLREIGFCLSHSPFFCLCSLPFPFLVACLHLSLTCGLPHPLTCCMIVNVFDASVALHMVLMSPTLRTPPRISLMLPIASCSFCATFVYLCPFYPVICSVVICTVLKGFPLPLSGFSLRNPSRFWLRSFSCFFLLQSQIHSQVVKTRWQTLIH